MSKPLTNKQRKFVEAHINGATGVEAARAAGYSESHLYEMASENLRKPNIYTEIEKYMTKAAAEANLRQIDVLKELEKWMTHKDRFDDPRIGALSLKATEMIGKHLKMWSERMEVSVHSHEKALAEIDELYKRVQKQRLERDQE